MRHRGWPGRRRLLSVLLPFFVAGLEGCGGARLPEPGSDAYREVVQAFYTGLTALQVGAFDRADRYLARAAELAPDEPAVWTNLGLLRLRLGDDEAAAGHLERARSLAPESSEIEALTGLLESRRGRPGAAIPHLRRAAELDPGHLKARYALAQEIERLGREGGDAEAGAVLEGLLREAPQNLVLLLEAARLAAKRGDGAALGAAVERLGALSGGWPGVAAGQYGELAAAFRAGDYRRAATRVAFLRNVLVREPAFRRDLAQVKLPAEAVGEPMARLLRLPAPRSAPAPPDMGLAFAAERPGGEAWEAVAPFWEVNGRPALVGVRSGRAQWLDAPERAVPFPGVKPGPAGVRAVDLDNDFRMDLALAGPGGLRLFRQGEDGAFADVTAGTGLGGGVTGAAYAGVWAADLEMDGDMDLVPGAEAGAPPALRNNGDGTFEALEPFEGLDGLRAFAWADVDGDGDPDAGTVDGHGRLRVQANERGGVFRPEAGAWEGVAALSVGDMDGDGALEFVALFADGRIARVHKGDAGWGSDELVRWPDMPAGPAMLLVADLDNNGAQDLVASAPGGARFWLGDGQGAWHGRALPAGVRVFAAADLTGDGRLDLAGLLGDGRPVRLVNRGVRGYHWQAVRPRAQAVAGDNRVNAFGIGGEVEARAGLLVQKQAVTGPVVHFGLGENRRADVVRVTWPNGTAQAEFELEPDRVVTAEQRLKGSCPWVFAYTGEGMAFVTDFLWRSPLGMRINAQVTADATQTEDRVLIRGDQLAARGGAYDVRITAELWETHFFDHVSLMVVDHPAGTEAFVDERFARQPPDLAVHVTGPLRPVRGAWDDAGREVTDRVRERDGRYLDTFALGRYQGLAEAHRVEVDLGEDAPAGGPVWLVAQGWIQPTDSSINVAIGQGARARPRGLSLEAQDGTGAWRTVHPDLGFPAGKRKTVLIDLEGVQSRRLRLKTNLEVYWDRIAWAEKLGKSGATEGDGGKSATEPHGKTRKGEGDTGFGGGSAHRGLLRIQRIAPEAADLRYRGFSAVTRAGRRSPEIPHYDRLAGTAQRWRDLVGYHTRYGDVRELLGGVDDRYVIMNAGDELALRFPAPPGPPTGWVRDFVLVGDGWVKDGDYNTAFSKTVLPLPAHGRAGYDAPPGRLEDDPVYRRHAQDWQAFHTRYVTPEGFRNGLRF